MSKPNDDYPESGSIGNTNPDKRGRGSGNGPNRNVGKCAPRDTGKGVPGKGKSK